MRNYWVVNYKVDYAMWNVVFDHITISVDDLREFVSKVVFASKKYQIAEVMAAPGYGKFRDYRALIGYEYTDYIDESIQQTGVFPFFKTLSASLDNNLIETKICYYNQDGDIETQASTNLGRLLREIHPDLLKRKNGEKYTTDDPPIEIACDFLDVQDGMIKDDDFVLHLALKSDIWFPKIFGLLQDDSREREYRNLPYDNSALANCHTPRLNQFLLAVRRAALDIGAIWRLDPDTPLITKDMVTETGIKLDI